MRRLNEETQRPHREDHYQLGFSRRIHYPAGQTDPIAVTAYPSVQLEADLLSTTPRTSGIHRNRLIPFDVSEWNGT
jgi:hypothetical protein